MFEMSMFCSCRATEHSAANWCPVSLPGLVSPLLALSSRHVLSRRRLGTLSLVVLYGTHGASFGV